MSKKKKKRMSLAPFFEPGSLTEELERDAFLMLELYTKKLIPLMREEKDSFLSEKLKDWKPCYQIIKTNPPGHE